ncbi:immunity protein Tsi6 family protein [Pasteurella skyensis]|uniref:Immunity protein Tsi6 family protein n=1 Tax=Phocoenobacter skyensis TaxID=97481 RepID=A0AAJ6P2W2_9PAST|nr:immunity protein Tsi6 family protein [Pasteurella skyensis]MDP8169704.1 immunity protein Tsi6 family protein [Pasteurella skyensis]MDP8175128.1 immunity protein Tsi6 family protein [Pasteurella skyensis]
MDIKYERINILNKAKKMINERLNKFPDYHGFIVIDEQIKYLLEVLTSLHVDRDKLNDINVGQYAVHIFESEDPELANILHEVSGIARDLIEENLSPLEKYLRRTGRL